MSSQSLYRKWRSQTFAEVVGQEHITRTLLNALRTGRVAHAYLFCGPRGTGKTSTARLLAKAVNCEGNDGQGEPCNDCQLCRAITDGRSLDIIEIDGASNRGIDEIRDLREKVNFAPGEAKRKFYIIDEVHQLTPEAFNALLKTLEEPPAHTVFVLASTEAHKIPATILSRCQRFDFRRIPLREMVSRLRYIGEAEGIEVEPAALELVARAATGSLRDAEGMLDQLRAYANGAITLAQTELLLGTGGASAARELMASLFQGDLGGGLRLINRLADEGTDMRQLGREVVAYLRELLLLRTGAVAADGLDVSAETAAAMADLAQTVGPGDIVRTLRLFSQMDFAARGLVHPQLPLEMAFAEAVLGDETRPREAATAPVRARATPQLPVVRDAGGAPPVRPNVRPTAARPAAAPQAESVPDAAPAPAGELAPADATAELAVEHLRDVWPRLLDLLGRADRKVQALLRDSTGPERVEGKAVVLGFGHSFHKEQVEQNKNRETVETVLSDIIGQPCLIRCELIVRREKARQASALEDPLVKEAVSQGARVKGVKNTSAMEEADDTK